MNKDETISLIVKILLMILSPLALKYHVDGATTSAIVTDVADLAVLGFGVWSHWNMRKVPENAKVIVPNGNVGSKTMTYALAGFIVLGVFGADHARASAGCDPNIFKNLLPSNFMAQLKTCAPNDVKLALDDATAQKDAIAISCLDPALQIVNALNIQGGGLVLAFQKFRDAKRAGALELCNAYVINTLK